MGKILAEKGIEPRKGSDKAGKSPKYKTVKVHLKFSVEEEGEEEIDRQAQKVVYGKMQLDVAGMKAFLRKLIDEHISTNGSRFSRDQLNNIIDDYAKFCFFDFLKLGIAPDTWAIEVSEEETKPA